MPRCQSRQWPRSNLRQDWPHIWLFTDERNDDVLEKAIAGLPKGSGIIFRHYHLDIEARTARLAEIVKLARRHRHLVLFAGSPRMARRHGADGVHGRQWTPAQLSGLIRSMPVHNIAEIREANRLGADLFFLSPVHATRSHPGQNPTSRLQIARLAALCFGPVILLGGMNASRYRSFRKQAQGWAAIDALSK